MEVIKGRMYDYNNGRFLSVDPFIQNPTSTQSLNPYTYIFNNPLSGVDPSGYIPCRGGVKDQCDGSDKKKYNDDLRKERKKRQNTSRGFSNFNGARSSGSNPNIGNFRTKDPSDVGKQSDLATNRPDGKLTGYSSGASWENGWYANQQGLFNSEGVRMYINYETGVYSDHDTNPIDLRGWELFIPIPAAWLAKLGTPVVKTLGKSFVMYLKRLNAIKHGWDKINTPASRHFLNKITQKTLAKPITTVIDNSVDVAADLKAIRTGQAIKKGNQFHINNRIYQLKPNGTSLFPVSGPGFHTLDNGAFKVLGILQKLGNTEKAQRIISKVGYSKEQITAATNVWRLGQ